MNPTEKQTFEQRLQAASTQEERIDIRLEMLFRQRFDNTVAVVQELFALLQEAQSISYEQAEGSALLNIAFCQMLLGRNEESLKYALKGLYLFERIKNDTGIARARLAMGIVQWGTGDYDQAIVNSIAGVKGLEAQEDNVFVGWGYNTLGGIYQDLGDTEQALTYYEKAYTIFERLHEITGQSRVLNGLAVLLERTGEYGESLEYSKRSLALHRSMHNVLGEARALNDMGSVLYRMGEYAEALECHELSLALRRQSNNPPSEITSLLNLGMVYTQLNEFARAHTLLLAALDLAQSIGAKPKICDIHHALSESFERSGAIEKAFEHYKLFHTFKEEVLSAETATKVRQLHTTIAIEQSEREAEFERVRNKELAAANTEISRQMEILDEQARNIELNNIVLEEKNLVIAQMHEESERLLLNILPKPIAERLKQGEQTIAEHFENVTVLFADIVGFTTLSAQISPRELVQVLDTLFSDFDALAERHGLEKIKTIGDAYMAVSGLPEARTDHAQAAAQMALDMQRVIKNFSVENFKENFSASGATITTELKIRIGLHTGAVVAGVIGKKKFTYDLWGDTVNIASRMESHGEPGKIHCSETVYSNLRKTFRFEKREALSIKGKGMMQTYFLLGKKTSLITK